MIRELLAAWEKSDFDAVATAFLLGSASRLVFIGNGGSAAIASHMANDFSKNGGMPCLTFNDGASLTCLGNDLGFEHVFAEPLEKHLVPTDAVIAISSSGRSPNVLAGARVVKENKATLVTFTGFDEDNPLREMGGLSVYVPSHDYGIVETAHLGMLHETLREIQKNARR